MKRVVKKAPSTFGNVASRMVSGCSRQTAAPAAPAATLSTPPLTRSQASAAEASNPVVEAAPAPAAPATSTFDIHAQKSSLAWSAVGAKRSAYQAFGSHSTMPETEKILVLLKMKASQLRGQERVLFVERIDQEIVAPYRDWERKDFQRKELVSMLLRHPAVRKEVQTVHAERQTKASERGVLVVNIAWTPLGTGRTVTPPKWVAISTLKALVSDLKIVTAVASTDPGSGYAHHVNRCLTSGHTPMIAAAAAPSVTAPTPSIGRVFGDEDDETEDEEEVEEVDPNSSSNMLRLMYGVNIEQLLSTTQTYDIKKQVVVAITINTSINDKTDPLTVGPMMVMLLETDKFLGSSK